MKGNIWQVVVLACAFALLLPATNVAFADAASEAVGNEAATVDYDNNTQLETDDVYQYNNVSVEANNLTLTNGTDYEFSPNDGDGQITWLNSSATSEGDAAEINIDYQDHSEQTSIIAKLLELLAQPLIWVLVLAIVGWILIAMVGGDF